MKMRRQEFQEEEASASARPRVFEGSSRKASVDGVQSGGGQEVR